MLSTRVEMEVVTSEEQLRTLSTVHRNLKEYRLGRSIQLMLKNLSTLRQKAHRQGYTVNNFQDRLAQLVVLIKTQDKEFNSLPHGDSFITKRSIHRKNSHLSTLTSLLRRSRRVCCKRLCLFLRLLLTTTTTIKM
jgi:hypothetical protein